MYHNHSSPGVLQLPWCATTSQWNVVQLPIGMHIIMIQLPLVCCNDTRKPMQTSCITTLGAKHAGDSFWQCMKGNFDGQI